jgi:hypothetical protein
MDFYSMAWLISDLGYFYVAWTTLETYPLYSCMQLIPPLLDIPYHLSQESADWAWTEQVAAVVQISAMIYAIITVLWPMRLYTHLVAGVVTLILPVVIFQVLVGPHYPPPGDSLLRHPNRIETPHFILCHTQGHVLLLLNYAILAHGMNQGAAKKRLNNDTASGASNKKKANIKSV